MEKEIRREAFRQYFRYFRFWFASVIILAVLAIGSGIFYKIVTSSPRTNTAAPEERVYDYADVLTDSEEEHLRKLIAECEKEGKADIVLVTLSQPMGDSDYEWEQNMMKYADDFYDEGAYGWDMPYGDGSLLLDNWYEGSKGAWLSTSGKMEQTIGSYEEGAVFDAMDFYVDTDLCQAYSAAIRALAKYGRNGAGYESPNGLGCMFFVAATVIALVYFLANLHQSKAKDTTNASTYLENGNPRIKTKSDTFTRKSVSSHKIQSSSSSGGHSSSSHRGGGSYGSHRSSSGHSHGGGGRRR